jgi:hypothetical protein
MGTKHDLKALEQRRLRGARVAQAWVHASRGSAAVRDLTPGGERVGGGVDERRQNGAAHQAPRATGGAWCARTQRIGTSAQGRRARTGLCHRTVDAQSRGRVDCPALQGAIQPHAGLAPARESGLQRAAARQESHRARRGRHCRVEAKALAGSKKTPPNKAA